MFSYRGARSVHWKFQGHSTDYFHLCMLVKSHGNLVSLRIINRLGSSMKKGKNYHVFSRTKVGVEREKKLHLTRPNVIKIKKVIIVRSDDNEKEISFEKSHVWPSVPHDYFLFFPIRQIFNPLTNRCCSDLPQCHNQEIKCRMRETKRNMEFTRFMESVGNRVWIIVDKRVREFRSVKSQKNGKLLT